MVAPRDREVHLCCSIDQKRDGWKYGAFLTEVLRRAVLGSWVGELRWDAKPLCDHLVRSP